MNARRGGGSIRRGEESKRAKGKANTNLPLGASALNAEDERASVQMLLQLNNVAKCSEEAAVDGDDSTIVSDNETVLVDENFICSPHVGHETTNVWHTRFTMINTA